MKDSRGDLGARQDDPIAIIGMSCRLPGGNKSPDDFWNFLLKKKSGITEVPEDRWGVDVFYDPDPAAISKSVSKWAGFVDDVRQFDAQFFGISPREAESMDPQQRLLLQGTCEAMQDAGIPLEVFSQQKTGVFVGISQSDYRTIQELRLTSSESFAGTGYALCINANRISHRLNLTGPSNAVDTACSSSMVALDQGVQNIRDGSCDMSVVAGVNILAHPSSFVAFSKAGMLSNTGKISTFDQNANGFVRGEGVGVVILKRYSEALKDGDRVHALIHATEVNQDGRTNTMTAPNQVSQIEMLEGLFEASGIDKSHIGFVEAHGTGTPIGDPIEAGAIGRVIGQHNPYRKVYVGSGKANIGHLESGAGIAGLIKATLAVKHGVVPPNINFKRANPNIPFDALNLEVPTKPQPFPDVDGRRYAVINSFGFGGTNGSALISSVPEPVAQEAEAPLPRAEDFPLFFPLSAASSEGLQANAAALLRALSGKGALVDADLTAISAALANDRSHLAHRAVVLARNQAELKAALRKLAKGDADKVDAAPNIVTGQVQPDRKICFMFAGQGSQWWAMARDLIETNSIFAAAVDAYDAHFVKASGWSIKAELLRDEATSRIDDTTVTQPALFAIQSGLAALWAHFGVKPDMVVGHSIGEAAASYVAGGISLEGAARFLNKRGAIRDQLDAKGAMAAIGMNHEDVEAMLPDHGKIGIAAINGPGSTTISGDYDAIHDFVDEFEMTHPDQFIRRLKVDTAWHSYQLEEGEAWFRKEMAKIDWSVPTLPFISTVTGKMESRFDTDYGWLNLRRPVLFQAGIEAALKMGATTFVELGPHATLAGPARSTALEAGARADVFNSISRKEPDQDVFARTAASLFVTGHALDWATITKTEAQKVELPNVVWMDEEFWKDSEESRHILHTPVKHPFLGMRNQDAGVAWKSEINTKAYPYLKDHRLQTDTIFPAAGYIDTLIAAANELFGDKAFEISDAVIHEALFLGDDQDVVFSSVYSPERGKMKLYTRVRDSREEWILRAEAFIRPTDVPAPKPVPFDRKKLKGLREIDTGYAYDVDTKDSFINYGDSFQVIDRLWMTRRKTIAHLKLREGAEPTKARHFLHPTMLDGCLQITDPRMTLDKIEKGRQPDDPAYLPVGSRRMRFFAPFPDEVMVFAEQVHNPESPDAEGGFVVTDMDGNVVVTMDGLMMRTLPGKDVLGEEIRPNFAVEAVIELRDDKHLEPATASGHWVVIGEKRDTRALVGAMEAAGAEVSVVTRAMLGTDPVGALTEEFGEAFEQGSVEGILYAAALGIPAHDPAAAAEDVLAPIETAVSELIALGDLMDFYRTTEAGLARVTVLTRGAYPGQDGRVTQAALSQAPVAAVARALASETPEYTVRIVDLDSAAAKASDGLAQLILGSTDESELILNGGQTLAPRLQPVEPEDLPTRMLSVGPEDRETNFHATMASPGVIDDLALCEIPLEALGEGEVRVRIAAVGLNFRDVMAVTGLLPEEAEPDPAWQHLGLEFGAVVEAVGSKVKGFKKGDRVMGLGRRCLQRFMTVDPRSLTLLPEHISLEEAATIPSAFATAHFALNRVGRMTEGDKVFIHVATGGVGTAAVQLAKAAGAEIFATAGSPKKRKVLRDWGVPHVMNSRSLKFADDVMRITKGRGVDLLLNSLPGDFISKGLEIIAPYGHFVEIGKRDVYADSAIGMKALRKNVSLSVLDLAAMGGERPELLADMFAELVAKFENRDLQPLPVTSFPISELADAFRYMSQAKHIGKVVVTLEDATFAVRRDPERKATLKKDASYLVTGGTKGFSLTIADWMSQAGAGELILASRSGKIERRDAKKVARIEARGTKVTVQSLDVTSEDAVMAFVKKKATAKTRPLRGVLHGAAVIKDGFANQMTPEMISDVLRPKILGGWALHKAFDAAGVQPDFLIGFSSIAQAIGSGGQTNYVAANAFLDALALYRRGEGLPGTAIDWGAIAESGFISKNDGLATYLESVGLHGLEDAETGAGMEIALTKDVARFVYSKADWTQIARANAAQGRTPRMAGMLSSEGGGNHELRARLMSLQGEALNVEVKDLIASEISNVLKVDTASISFDRPMSELGLDSLSSFELKMRIETALDFTLPVSKFLQAPSVDELSDILTEEIEARAKAEAEAAERRDEDGGAGDDRGGAARGLQLPSNRQIGLIADALAPMTSDEVRGAMELRRNLRVPGTVQASDVEKALKSLNRRHRVLRLSHDGNPWEDGVSFDGQGLALADDATEGPLDVGGGEFARVAAKWSAKSLDLALTLHRAVADDVTADLVAKELKALLKGETLTRAAPAKKAFEALADMRFDAESAAATNDRMFWWYGLCDGATAVTIPGRGRPMTPVGLGRDHGPAASIDGDLNDFADEADLLVRFARALRALSGEDGPVLMSRGQDIRQGGVGSGVAGPFEIEQPVLVPDDPGALVALAGLRRAMEHAGSHLAFDSAAAAHHFADDFRAWGVTPFQIGVNTTKRALGKGAAEGITYDVFLDLSLGSKPRFRLSYDQDILTPDMAKALAQALSGKAADRKPASEAGKAKHPA